MTQKYAAVLTGPMIFAAAACAADRIPPKALVEARADCLYAKGIAIKFDPNDVHEAELALQRAELAWQESPGDPVAGDLAIVADRKAMLALSEAATIKAKQDTQQATAAIEARKAAQLRAAEEQFDQTREALGATQMQLQQQAAAPSVKDDDLGMVITLQGELLFKTGKWDLKPAAMAKLDQIAEALKSKPQSIAVFGYTDAVGSRDDNMALSQRRAKAVRDYLVTRGIPQELVTAQGRGPDEPVADNGSLEGRAQNRRVEIVVRPNK